MDDSLIHSYHSNEGFSFGGKYLMYENYPNINKQAHNAYKSRLMTL